MPPADPAPPAGATVLHVATPEGWAEAQRTGAVCPPSLADEGFVHCSTRDQLPGTLARHYAGHGPLLALVVDVTRLDAPLRWEESRPGQRFPHVYGPIALEAVVAVEPIPPA